MQEIEHKKGKIYYSMGEVAEMFDVNPSLLRYWEQEFDILRPHRNKKGNRLFTPKDVDNIRIIYHLLKERKMKIEVARKYLRDHRGEADRNAEITEKLLNIRALLLEIKQDLSCGGTLVDEDQVSDATDESAVCGWKAPHADKHKSVLATPEALFYRDARNPGSNAAAEAVSSATKKETESTGVADREEAKPANSSYPGKPPFEEQVLFDVAVPLELVQEVSRSTDEGFESAKAGFMGGTPIGQDESEESPTKPEAIEQTLF